MKEEGFLVLSMTIVLRVCVAFCAAARRKERVKVCAPCGGSGASEDGELCGDVVLAVVVIIFVVVVVVVVSSAAAPAAGGGWADKG